MTARASILLAHGSSDPHWLAPFEELLTTVKSHSSDIDTPVELAYMELAQPDLHTQAAKLVEQGIEHIDVLPLFFAAGRHLRRDVPKILEDIEQLWHQQGRTLTISLHAPIGMEPEVKEAISQVIARQLND